MEVGMEYSMKKIDRLERKTEYSAYFDRELITDPTIEDAVEKINEIVDIMNDINDKLANSVLSSHFAKMFK